MIKLKIVTVVISMLLFQSIISLDVAATETDETQISSTIAKWTYMTYTCFDVDIGKGILVNDTEYFYETLKNIGSSEDMNSVALFDTGMPDDITRFLYFKESGVVENMSWFETDSNMGDKETLIRYVKEVKERFPAERYALVLQSPRGMSWQGVMKDDDILSHPPYTHAQWDQVFMSMPDFSSALREITNNGREKIDVIGFSTCITGSLEVAYQIAPFSNYMVASEENMQSYTSSPLNIWPLNKSLSGLKNNPGMTGEEFAKSIVDLYTPGKDTKGKLCASPFKKIILNITIDTTLAASNLSRVEHLAIAIDNLSKILKENIGSYHKIMMNSRNEARRFGPWYSKFATGYWVYIPILKKQFDRIGYTVFMDVWLDIHHFAQLLKSKITDDYPKHDQVKDACQDVMDALNYTILANNVTEGDNASGLHIYFPNNAYRYNQHIWAFPYLNLIWIKPYVCYEDTDFADKTGWNEMLYSFYRIPDYLVEIWLKGKIPLF